MDKSIQLMLINTLYNNNTYGNYINSEKKLTENMYHKKEYHIQKDTKSYTRKTNKNNRRNHIICQPGIDCQRKQLK
jgi:hypothetical protein